MHRERESHTSDIRSGAYFSANGGAPRSWAVQAVIHVTKVLAVYLAALVAFAFLRAASSGDSLHLVAGMIGLHGRGHGLPLSTLVQVALLFAIICAAPKTQQNEPVRARTGSFGAEPLFSPILGAPCVLGGSLRSCRRPGRPGTWRYHRVPIFPLLAKNRTDERHPARGYQ